MGHCQKCGKFEKLFKFVRQDSWFKVAVTFVCAICLGGQVAFTELGYSKAVRGDRASNDFSTDAVDHVFTSTSGTIVPDAQHMIDFANIYQVQLPTPFEGPSYFQKPS